MRLWSLHPKYLDAKGLVALWRETLLAQAVLAGRTRGYRHHPQLARFRTAPAPPKRVANYLRAIHAEASARGYRFDAARIGRGGRLGTVAVTEGRTFAPSSRCAIRTGWRRWHRSSGRSRIRPSTWSRDRSPIGKSCIPGTEDA